LIPPWFSLDSTFKPNKATIDYIAGQLIEAGMKKENHVELDLLSNAAFTGSTNDGIRIPASKGVVGRDHMSEGVLNVVPATVVKKILVDCDVLARVLGGTSSLWLPPSASLCHCKMLYEQLSHCQQDVGQLWER
jgi:hypothetical protein